MRRLDLPASGRCGAPDRMMFADHIDTTEPRACTDRHTTETFAMFAIGARADAGVASTLSELCEREFRGWAGATSAVSRASFTVTFSTKEQSRDAGEAFARCNAIELGSFNGTAGIERMSSLEGSLVHGVPDALRACTSVWPDSRAVVRLARCDRPHKAELVPVSLRLGTLGTAYPGESVVARQTARWCRAIGRSYVPAASSVYWYYPVESGWRQGRTFGSCFGIAADGSRLSPI